MQLLPQTNVKTITFDNAKINREQIGTLSFGHKPVHFRLIKEIAFKRNGCVY